MLKQLELDKEARKQYRSVIENLKMGNIDAADYNAFVDESLSLYDNCIMLLNRGKCAEAAKYYMDSTGLELEDAIDYIKDV